MVFLLQAPSKSFKDVAAAERKEPPPAPPAAPKAEKPKAPVEEKKPAAVQVAQEIPKVSYSRLLAENASQ